MSDYKTQVRRHPERSSDDRAVIDSILDEAYFCHVGFVDDGIPYVIPTIHVRVGDTLVLHGSQASRMMRTVRQGVDLCVTATLFDGLVLARSVFNHSMNYRSVVVLGRAQEITDTDRKLEAMRVFTEKILPGRWGDARIPSDKEFKTTLMAGIAIDAATAKVRSGPPLDDPDDVDLPVWAGVVPFGLTAGAPEPAPDLTPELELPEDLRRHLGLT